MSEDSALDTVIRKPEQIAERHARRIGQNATVMWEPFFWDRIMTWTQCNLALSNPRSLGS